jgi:hypothetical protein
MLRGFMLAVNIHGVSSFGWTPRAVPDQRQWCRRCSATLLQVVVRLAGQASPAVTFAARSRGPASPLSLPVKTTIVCPTGLGHSYILLDYIANSCNNESTWNDLGRFSRPCYLQPRKKVLKVSRSRSKISTLAPLAPGFFITTSLDPAFTDLPNALRKGCYERPVRLLR